MGQSYSLETAEQAMKGMGNEKAEATWTVHSSIFGADLPNTWIYLYAVVARLSASSCSLTVLDLGRWFMDREKTCRKMAWLSGLRLVLPCEASSQHYQTLRVQMVQW